MEPVHGKLGKDVMSKICELSDVASLCAVLCCVVLSRLACDVGVASAIATLLVWPSLLLTIVSNKRRTPSRIN